MSNLVLLHDHIKGHNKIQETYIGKLIVMDSKHQDPNVYTIKPLNGKGPMHTVNWWQLFDLQNSQGDNLWDQVPDTTLPTILAKKTPNKNPSK